MARTANPRSDIASQRAVMKEGIRFGRVKKNRATARWVSGAQYSGFAVYFILPRSGVFQLPAP